MLEYEFVAPTPHHQSIDGLIELLVSVVFALALERFEPIDTSLCGGNIAVQTTGYVVDNLHEF